MSLPNQLTVLRIILSPVFVFLLFSESALLRWISFAVFIVASLTDWYDGYIARKFGIVTKWGKFLDPLADKILISAGFISFCTMGYIAEWMVVTVIVRDIIITILRSYGIYKGKPIATSTFAKVKTFSQVILLYLIYGYFIYTDLLKMHGYQWIFNSDSALHFFNIAMLFVTIVTVATGFLYMFYNRSCIKEMKRDICRFFIPSNT